MKTELPDDLLSFLRAGRNLSYDIENSEIGRIRLARETDLTLSTITTFPNCQSIMDDPYEDIDGMYQIDVYDLVAKSDTYRPEGLLCWIVALKCFGCVDPEHGDVLTFPDVTWTDITEEPRTYLDAQWDDEIGMRALPWLHFPFKLNDGEAVIPPYGSRCPVHDAPVTAHRLQKPDLFYVLRRRAMDDWLRNCLTVFPCPGVPINDDDLLCCIACREAENQWIAHIEDAIAPLDAKLYSQTWVKCPGCGIRFSTADRNQFGGGVHLSCGQKINVVA
jgi:hypothetical protein